MGYTYLNTHIGRVHVVEVPMTESYRDRYSPDDPRFDELMFGPGTKAVYFWYGRGSYDGAGKAIVLFENGGAAQFDLGHCSCNGPLDSVPQSPESKTLAALVKRMTPECAKDFATILFAIKQAKRGKKL